jgi:hypothetical protein
MRDGRRIETETLVIDFPNNKGRRPRRREPFVKITATQAGRLRQVRNAATLKIFIDILFLNFEGHGRPFTLPNSPDISRDQRYHALTDLEKLRLISVRRDPGRPVLIVEVSA